MSILTKKKNGSNHKAKTISIPRKKQNMHKTRKNIGKSRKNMGVKTLRGGSGTKYLSNGAPQKKTGFFGRLFRKTPKVNTSGSADLKAKGVSPFAITKTNPLYHVYNSNLSKNIKPPEYSVAGQPNPLGQATKNFPQTPLNFSQPVAGNSPVKRRIAGTAKLPNGRTVPMFKAQVSNKIVRSERPDAFRTNLSPKLVTYIKKKVETRA